MRETTAPGVPEGLSGGPMSGLAARLVDISSRLPHRVAPPGGRALLLTVDNGVDSALPPMPGWAVYRLPRRPPARATARQPGLAAADPEGAAVLPFADSTFESICVYGAILQIVQHPGILNKVLRMLRPGGVALVVEPLRNFSFTTFPIGGPAHLLRRQLLQAGFRNVHALAGDAALLAFVAQRAAMDDAPRDTLATL